MQGIKYLMLGVSWLTVNGRPGSQVRQGYQREGIIASGTPPRVAPEINWPPIELLRKYDK